MCLGGMSIVIDLVENRRFICLVFLVIVFIFEKLFKLLILWEIFLGELV